MGEWNDDMDAAPRDGSEFIACLSNGRITILSEIPGAKDFPWYRSQYNLSVPIARAHRGDLSGRLVATHWMHLPSPPSP
jgi:hypothetical protein